MMPGDEDKMIEVPLDLVRQIQLDLRQAAIVQHALGWEQYARSLRQRADLLGLALQPAS